MRHFRILICLVLLVFSGCTSKESGPYDFKIFLRGDFNDWSTTDPFVFQDDNLYSIVINLPAGWHEFKIAAAKWEDLDLGMSVSAAIEPYKWIPLTAQGKNILYNVTAAGSYAFVFDPKDPGRVRIQSVSESPPLGTAETQENT